MKRILMTRQIFSWDWGNNAPSLKWRFVPNARFFSEFVLTRSNFDFDVNLKHTETDSDGTPRTKQSPSQPIKFRTFPPRNN